MCPVYDLPLVFIENNTSRFELRPAFPYGTMPFFDLLLPIRMQILGILLVVPADPAVKKILALFLSAVPAVNIFRVIKFLQDPVIPAFLFDIDVRCPVFRTELPNAVSVIDMRLFQMAFLTLGLCPCAIDDMDVIILLLLHHSEHLPPDHGHISGRRQRLELWLLPI